MNDSLRYDIMCDNFDYYFESRARQVTQAQKEFLPTQLLIKLYNKAGHYNQKGADKLTFLEKAFILNRLKSKIYIVVQDDEKGEGMEEFMSFRETHKKRNYATEDAGGAIQLGTFFLANKELSDTFDYLNRLNTSPAYTFLTKPKNAKQSAISKWQMHMNYIFRFLCHYESTKKKTIGKESLNMPEFLVLLYLYDKKEVIGSEIYKNVYRYSFYSSPRRIRQAFCTLQQKGYLLKNGERNGSKWEITNLGKGKMNEMGLKTFLNL